MDAILNDKEKLDLFVAFCERRYCSENIHFWIALQEYKQLEEDILREMRACALYDKYVKPGSPLQVNLDGPLVEQVASRIEVKDTPANLFDEIEERVYMLMHTDSLPAFLKSEKKQAEFVNKLEKQATEIEIVGNWSHSQRDDLRTKDSALAKKLEKELVKLDFAKHQVGMDAVKAEEENKRLAAWCTILEKESDANKQQVMRLQKTAMRLLADTESLKAREQKLLTVLRQTRHTLQLLDTE